VVWNFLAVSNAVFNVKFYHVLDVLYGLFVTVSLAVAPCNEGK
jgi:hypothetical protein